MDLEGDGLALAAGVDGLLDAVGVESGFVGGGEGVVGAVVDGGEVRVKGGAEGRDHRFGDGAGVLGKERNGESGEESEGG